MSRRSFLVGVLIICLAAGYFYLFSDYMKLTKARDSFTEQVNSATRTLALIPKTPTDLSRQLEEAEEAYAAAREAIGPGSISSTGVMESVFKLADGLNVEVTPLRSSPGIEKKTTANVYHLLRIEFGINGRLDAVNDLVARLEDRESFPTLVIEVLSVERSGNQTGQAEVDVTGSLQVALFTLVEEAP